jgi:hypothetical protein
LEKRVQHSIPIEQDLLFAQMSETVQKKELD